MTMSAKVAPNSETDAQEITEPHEHDVLCGRGGSINSWKGNERFRTLVERRKRIYLTARFKREKRLIASSIVSEIQALEPPGRFLSRNAKKGTWYVIDDDKARDKVSQALRENAPSIRAEIETEIHEQRAEIHRTQQQHQPPPPPNAAQNPYYSDQGWGYFSYYGYAQQSTHRPGPPPPPPPPHGLPPPPGYLHHHPGYYHGGNVSPHQHLAPHGSGSSSPCTCNQQQQPHAATPSSNDPMPPPPPQAREPVQSPAPAPAPPPAPARREKRIQDDADDKSVLDALSESMSAILSPSLASWTKDAFSIGGGMSLSSINKDDKDETVSVASKPIKYVHQPEDRSVSSRERAVHFKGDERSLSGRALDSRKKALPPRIMHSSQISYPRRPKMLRRGSNGASIPRPPGPANGNPAPLSSVNLSDNDGMISLITTEGMNSIMEDGPLILENYEEERSKHAPNEEYKDSEQDTEPIPVDRKPTTRRSDSGLTAVANQIVMSMGSLDASTVACGVDNVMPDSVEVPKEIQHFSETMAVEIEGQEVQLVDDDFMDMGDNSVVESRIPGEEKHRIEMEDWPSRIGSCHSWLPEPLGNAASFANASFFSQNSRGSFGVSPASSMDMDVSSGTEHFSCGGSIGGASLCKVFDSEAQPHQQNALPSPHSMLGNRGLNRMPSWERSLRNKSPLSLGSGELDDQSLVSKGSEKLMGGSISTIGSGDNNERTGGDRSQSGMTWDSFTKE